MILSCCTWALSGEDRIILSTLSEAGFSSIDIRPFDFTSDDARRHIHELGLTVSCMGLSFGMPDGAALESSDAATASRAMDHTCQSLDCAARSGITTSYVVPGMDSSPEALSRYADVLVKVADQASSCDIKLCIEHFPDRALPTVLSTLDFIGDIGHPNLYLLFDIGHAQISGEDPVEAIHTAGSRLGYVHLDDNDGKEDLHLSLLDGVLTEDTLRRALIALQDIEYNGPISLELHPELPDPLGALQQSREIVLRVAPELSLM